MEKDIEARLGFEGETYEHQKPLRIAAEGLKVNKPTNLRQGDNPEKVLRSAASRRYVADRITGSLNR